MRILFTTLKKSILMSNTWKGKSSDSFPKVAIKAVTPPQEKREMENKKLSSSNLKTTEFIKNKSPSFKLKSLKIHWGYHKKKAKAKKKNNLQN